MLKHKPTEIGVKYLCLMAFLWGVGFYFLPFPVSFQPERSTSAANTVKSIGSYIANANALKNHSSADELKLAVVSNLESEGCRNDPWGNPYKFRFENNGIKSSYKCTGAFSLGEDQASLSSGNDSDDISSWNMKAQLAYYRAKHEAVISARVYTSFLYALGALLGWLLLIRIWQQRDKKRPN